MNTKLLFKEIYNRYGAVTRARNCFLYTKKGIRLTDLYQENGRAILGWDAGNAFTFLKNTINRGQVGSFICEDNNRLEKAINQLLFSERKLFFFSSKKDALQSGISLSPENTFVWKPWNETDVDWTSADCVIIVPPLPWTESIFILAVKTDCLENNAHKTQNLFYFPNEITLPFAVQTGITRAVYNMLAAIQTRQEKDWFVYDTVLTKYWERKGPYLHTKLSKDDYDAFVLHCLDCGLVINPDYNNASIIPFGADKGVFTKLKNNPFQPKI